MVRPVLLKIGGSVITDKAAKPRFRKTVARRILSEASKVDVPLLVLHGAGSFGHPQAKEAQIGSRPVTAERRAGVSRTLAMAGLLHAEMVLAAHEAGLRPVSIPLHLITESSDDGFVDLPVKRIQRLLDEGHTPVIGGTLVRDEALGWRVLSADEAMALLAHELHPRLAVFATDVDGVYDRDPAQDGAQLVQVLRVADLEGIETHAGRGEDVTGRMGGKLTHAFTVAAECPTWIANGSVRGRVQDVLKGKTVPGTRLEA